MKYKIAFILIVLSPIPWVCGIIHTVRHNSGAVLVGLAASMLLVFLSFWIATGGRRK